PVGTLYEAVCKWHAALRFPPAQQDAEQFTAALRFCLREAAVMRSRDRTRNSFRPLAARLVTTVIAVCAGCAVLATLILTGQAWQDSVLTRKRAMQEISDSRMSML